MTKEQRQLNGERIVFSTNGAGTTGHPHAKKKKSKKEKKTKKKLDTDFISFTKINSKWIIDINVKCKTIKLEENIWENLGGLGFSDDFLDTAPNKKID